MKKWIFWLFTFLFGNYYFYAPTYSILDHLEAYNFVAKTDKHYGGTSELSYTLEPNKLTYSYKKSNAIRGAFVALYFEKKDSSFFELEGYKINIKGKIEGRGVIDFRLEVAPEQKIHERHPYIFLHRTVLSKEGEIDQTIHLDELEIPWWWTENNKLFHKQAPKVNFNRTVRLLFDGGEGFGDADFSHIEINAIELVPTFLGLKIFNSMYIIVCVLFLFFSTRKKKSPIIQKEIVLAPYHKTEIETIAENTDEKKVIHYLSKNYMNFDLGLSQISDELGIPQRRISEIIKEKYELSFKQYLNNLRIAEAKNLLQNTNQRISEIGYSVGYDNPNHFLRVFKTQTELTPSEYRDKFQKSAE